MSRWSWLPKHRKQKGVVLKLLSDGLQQPRCGNHLLIKQRCLLTSHTHKCADCWRIQCTIQYQIPAFSYWEAHEDAPNCTVELKKTFKFNLTETHFNGLPSRKFDGLRFRNIYIKIKKLLNSGVSIFHPWYKLSAAWWVKPGEGRTEGGLNHSFGIFVADSKKKIEMGLNWENGDEAGGDVTKGVLVATASSLALAGRLKSKKRTCVRNVGQVVVPGASRKLLQPSVW